MPSAAAVAVLQVIRPDRRRRVILWHAYPLAEQMRADQVKARVHFAARCRDRPMRHVSALAGVISEVMNGIAPPHALENSCSSGKPGGHRHGTMAA